MREQEDVLAELRQQIDTLDREIVECLQRRAALAKRVGAEKGENVPIYVPERERQVLAHVAAGARDGLLDAAALENIYREVLSACRALEKTYERGVPGPREHLYASSCPRVIRQICQFAGGGRP